MMTLEKSAHDDGAEKASANDFLSVWIKFNPPYTRTSVRITFFKEYLHRLVSMKNKAIIILIVVAGFLAALYLMGYFPFGNEPKESNNEDFSIKSNDESAELFIPKGALPDNVEIEDVSVTKASNIVTDNGTWAVYELEPDGLVFKEEILFNVTLESPINITPIVFISSSTGVELVNNTFSEFDLENGTQIISIPLSHFSRIHIFHDTTTFNVKISAPDVLVGEKVNTIASFTLLNSRLLLDMSRTGDGIGVYEFLDPHVLYKGTWSIIDEPNYFTPWGYFGGKPSTTQVGLGQTNTVQDDTFKGKAEGGSDLNYLAVVTVDVKFTHYNSERDYLDGNEHSSGILRNQKINIYRKVHVKCTNPKLIIQSTISTSYENKLLQSSLIAEIQGPPNAAGFATLTGSGMDPMIQPLLLGPDGSTSIRFIHTFSGEVTLLVEVGELTAERKINVG
jgi:hypothetical protein